MFRIIRCSKDTYITDKIIKGDRCTDSNVGQAGTLDLFKLYGETILNGSESSNATELSRILLKFDFSQLQQLTSSFFNVSDPSLKCVLKLKNIRGGQPVPSNFSVVLYPLAQSFDEGRGRDVTGFRDIDSTNFITASVNPTTALWFVSGANASGSVGDNSIDYFVSGNLGSGMQYLGVSASFQRGNEDLVMDITQLVSGVVGGVLPDNGFRLSFIESQEQDQTTRFVKRFASRHVDWFGYRPKIEVSIDTSISDQTTWATFDRDGIITYRNMLNGAATPFYSGSNQITGSNCLYLTLVASGSVPVVTSSWSLQHSASVTYTTTSTVYYSQSFLASQVTQNSYAYPGIYQATFHVSSSDLAPIIGNKNSLMFQPLWQSLDQTVTYLSGTFFKITKQNYNQGTEPQDTNNGVSVVNLKHEYKHTETPTLKLFIQNTIKDRELLKTARPATSLVFEEVHWRILHSITKEIFVDFDTTNLGTKLNSSYDEGMWFKLYLGDLEPDQVYFLEFMIVDRDNGKTIISNPDWKFKVLSK